MEQNQQGTPPPFQSQQSPNPNPSPSPNPGPAPQPTPQQPPRPQAPTEAAPADWGRIGGWLLAFIVMQAIQIFAMLSDFPSLLEDALEGVMAGGPATAMSMAIAVCDWLALGTLVAYAVAVIVALVQLVQRHPLFLRNFQLAGIVAVAGNFVVFLVMEAIHVYYSTSPGVVGYEPSYGYSWEAGSHWTLVVLALMWTIFWTLYFARSVRVRHYLGSDSHLDHVLFGRGMRSA